MLAILLLYIHEIPSHFSYKVTPETGYVAEVRYEGTPVFDAVVPVPSARLTEAGPPPAVRSQGGRQISKRIDENAFDAPIATPVKSNQKVPAFFKA